MRNIYFLAAVFKTYAKTSSIQYWHIKCTVKEGVVTVKEVTQIHEPAENTKVTDNPIFKKLPVWVNGTVASPPRNVTFKTPPKNPPFSYFIAWDVSVSNGIIELTEKVLNSWVL